ncbi:MAG: hypothetical protein K6F91_03020 [Ruminococcus sp.]|nr:hypothetical protein [Ruminococcus sp.]
MPLLSHSSITADVPLGLSIAIEKDPSVLQIFESLDSGEIKALAGLCDTAQTDMNGRINGLYAAADSFGRVRMF